jgi:pimeloyl-ACP methyl ester carboxylesterase
MKYLLFPFLVFLFAMHFSTQLLGQEKPDPMDITGPWNGSLQVGGTELPLVFHFEKNDDGYTGTMDSPAQGAEGIPMSELTVAGKKISLRIQSIGFQFEGSLSDSSLIEGEMQQRGQTFPLSLKRGEYVEPSYPRPQHPQPPFPYEIEEVRFENKSADISLAGTLTLPQGEEKPPVVVLISGSGPQDRDCEVAKHKLFWVIADHLSRNGIGVLRFDDRGVGESEGRFGSATTADFASDVEAAVDFLRKRKDIDRKAIGLVGHSEGGMVAPMVANRSKHISFLVLMAAPGRDGQQILLKQSADIQRAGGIAEEQIESSLEMMKSIQDIIIQSEDKEQAEEQLRKQLPEILDALPAEQLESIPNRKQYIELQIMAYNNPWMRFFLKYDPLPALKKLTCPVLVMNGSKDLQVDAETNLQAIKEAFSASANEHVKFRELEGLNHLFQEAESGAPSEYLQIEQTIAPVALNELLKAIEEFSERK